MFLRLIVLAFIANMLTCFAPVSLHAQTDSVGRSPKPTREEISKTVEAEFRQWKDSMEGVRIKRNVAKNGKPLNEFLNEMEERERAAKRQRTYLVGIGVLFSIVLAAGLARRWKRR